MSSIEKNYPYIRYVIDLIEQNRISLLIAIIDQNIILSKISVNE